MRKLMFTLRKLYSLLGGFHLNTHTHTHTLKGEMPLLQSVCAFPFHTGSVLKVTERLEKADGHKVRRSLRDKKMQPVCQESLT